MVPFFYPARAASKRRLGKSTIEHLGTVAEGRIVLEFYGKTAEDGRGHIFVTPRCRYSSSSGRQGLSSLFYQEDLAQLGRLLLDSSALIENLKTASRDDDDSGVDT